MLQEHCGLRVALYQFISIILAQGNNWTYSPVLEGRSNMCFLYRTADIGFDASIHPDKLDLPLCLREKGRLLGSVGQKPHHQESEQDRRCALDDEEKSPVRDAHVRVLDAEGNEATDGARVEIL